MSPRTRSRHAIVPEVADRSHCTCTAVNNIPFSEAAGLLGCTERWLKDRKHQVIHQHIGGKRWMCPCELLLAQAAFTITPRQAEATAPEPVPAAPADVPAQHLSAVERLHLIAPAGALAQR